MNKWFRLYAEFAHDPKVQRLTEAEQRRYIMLLCLRCSNGDVTLHDEDVTFQLRISDAEWADTKHVLLEKKLITKTNAPTAWEKRQYVSDSSAERVARHRAKRRNSDVTLQKRRTNALDTDTDTDTDNKTPQTPQGGFADFWAAWPPSKRKVAKSKCAEAWEKHRLESIAELILANVQALSRSEQWQQGFEPAPLTYLRQRRWEDGEAATHYSEMAEQVMDLYNAILGSAGWPEAASAPFSADREQAVLAFLGFSAKPDWVQAYFDAVLRDLQPRAGCGFDWLIRKETFLRVREGVYGVAA